jgi:hypothetical protein
MIDDHALDLGFRAPLRNRTIDLLLTISTACHATGSPLRIAAPGVSDIDLGGAA